RKPEDFYKHFVIELVPNYVHSANGYGNGLNNCVGKHPRMENANMIWNMFYDMYQLPHNFGVMYTGTKDGSGRVTQRETLVLDRNSGSDFDMVRWNYNRKPATDMPFFVAFPFPTSGVEDHIWIDLNWPIRCIYITKF
ncbi:hypothetical protein KFL_017870010, partial [Klebsormidium nitens]